MKAAQVILTKISPVLTIANSLMSGDKYYLLHDEIVRPFVDALDDLRQDNDECQEVVATGGAKTIAFDMKAITPKMAAVRKHVALLTNMLASLSRR